MLNRRHGAGCHGREPPAFSPGGVGGQRCHRLPDAFWTTPTGCVGRETSMGWRSSSGMASIWCIYGSSRDGLQAATAGLYRLKQNPPRVDIGRSGGPQLGGHVFPVRVVSLKHNASPRA